MKRSITVTNVKFSERKFKVILRIKNVLNAVDTLNGEIKQNEDLKFLKKSYQVII